MAIAWYFFSISLLPIFSKLLINYKKFLQNFSNFQFLLQASIFVQFLLVILSQDHRLYSRAGNFQTKICTNRNHEKHYTFISLIITMNDIKHLHFNIFDQIKCHPGIDFTILLYLGWCIIIKILLHFQQELTKKHWTFPHVLKSLIVPWENFINPDKLKASLNHYYFYL